jgi:hypothetical protein
VVGRVADEQRLARLRHAAGDAAADLRPEQVDRSDRLLRGEIAAEGDRNEIVALTDEHATVVVIDEEPELLGDRQADLAHVVQARKLSREALQHLQVRDRAHVVTAGTSLGRPFVRRLVEGEDQPLAAALRRHHRGLGARDELAWVRRVLGTHGDAGRHGQRPGRLRLERPELGLQPVGERE